MHIMHSLQDGTGAEAGADTDVDVDFDGDSVDAVHDLCVHACLYW